MNKGIGREVTQDEIDAAIDPRFRDLQQPLANLLACQLGLRFRPILHEAFPPRGMTTSGFPPPGRNVASQQRLAGS
ncbi:MAG TPA: hypothetical protein VMJ31_03100, partial [Methylocystis sp.]|nr:hypothetical protein [Methylocystis sp.]